MERKEHADEIIEKLAEQTSKRAVSGTQKMRYIQSCRLFPDDNEHLHCYASECFKQCEVSGTQKMQFV